jgi:hypothetical protein
MSIVLVQCGSTCTIRKCNMYEWLALLWRFIVTGFKWWRHNNVTTMQCNDIIEHFRDSLLINQAVNCNTYIDSILLQLQTTETLKPSLSMKILSINIFAIKLLSKLLSDLSIGVHLKSSFDTKKFGSKVSNRQYFNKKNSLLWKNCLLITLLPNFLAPFKWTPI